MKINGPLLGREGTLYHDVPGIPSRHRAFPLSPLALSSSVLEFNGPTIYELTSRIIERKYCDKTIRPVTSSSSSLAYGS